MNQEVYACFTRSRVTLIKKFRHVLLGVGLHESRNLCMFYWEWGCMNQEVYVCFTGSRFE